MNMDLNEMKQQEDGKNYTCELHDLYCSSDIITGMCRWGPD